MTRIWLLRHAEAEGNLYRRIHGCTDSGLTELGFRQLKPLGERFAGVPVYVYDCQSDIGGAERRYQLKYFIPECRWELFKM